MGDEFGSASTHLELAFNIKLEDEAAEAMEKVLELSLSVTQW